VLVRRYGGPEQLRLIERPAPLPGPGEVRLRVVAAPVAFPDVLIRECVYPDGPRPPFVPGYSAIGTVDALGAGVADPPLGATVAALTVHGAYAEHAVQPAAACVPVPDRIDLAEAAVVILNYTTAYQMVRRVAHARPGQRLLVHGAAGGVELAALELAGRRGLRVWGTASASARPLVEARGATVSTTGESALRPCCAVPVGSTSCSTASADRCHRARC
jgi:NADPH:quinone reductase